VSAPFLLDTNVLSELTKPAPTQSVVEWVNARPTELFHISVVTVGELRRGFNLMDPGKRRSNLEQWFDSWLLPLFDSRILPLNQAILERWATISALRQQVGKPIAMADGLIAATAMHYDLTLVTRNTKDFTGIDLKLINPWE